MSDANNGPDSGQQAPEGAGGQSAGGANNQPATWDTVLGGLSDEHKGLFETHVGGLKNSLQAARNERDSFAKQLKGLEKAAEGNEGLQKTIRDLQAQVESATKKTNFLTDTGGMVQDPELAFLAAEKMDAFDRQGRVNIEALKAAHPTLFISKQTPPGNIGSGHAPGGKGQDANALIRAIVRGKSRV